MLDLLDEAPRHQRGSPLVRSREQRLTVVENDFEQRSEGGFEVGDVGGVEFDRMFVDESVECAGGVVVRALQAGVPRDQGGHVLAVGGRVLTLLA